MMSKMVVWLLRLLGLVVVVGLAVVLAMVFRTVPGRIPTGQSVSPIETPVVTPKATPTLEESIIIVPTVGPEGEMSVWPTLTPWPTFTPWPTPTPRPGPTVTAMPLPQPAKDASGDLFYVVRTQFRADPGGYLNEGKMYHLQVDAKGEVITPAQPRDVGWVRMYPSWDNTLAALVASTAAGDHIYILDPATMQITSLPELSIYGRFLGWHPNNQEILFLVEGGEPVTGVSLINFETGKQSLIVFQRPLYIQDATMSPDGQRIVYSSQKGFASPGELWMAYVDGSDPKLLASGGAIFGLAWSSDGEKIAFVDGAQGLVVVDVNGTNHAVVARNFRGGYQFKPIWSPDSRYLAYVAFEPEVVPPDIDPQDKKRGVQDWDKEAFLGSNIHVIDITSREERVLSPITPTDDITGNIDPAWSPDGKMIVFAGLRDVQAALWIINVDGTGLRQVIEAPDLIRFPVWLR